MVVRRRLNMGAFFKVLDGEGRSVVCAEMNRTRLSRKHSDQN